MSDLKALEKTALNLLARREHSRVELAQKLTQRGFAVSDIDPLLDRLEAKDYLSESRFVEMLLRSRQNRGYGPIRVEQELRQKGVASALIADYLAGHETAWQQAAVVAYQKKYGARVPENTAEKLKCLRYLQSRGFTQVQMRGAIPSSENEYENEC